MPWARINDKANSDAKLLALTNGAWRLFFAGLAYCNDALTDGFVPDYIAATFGLRSDRRPGQPASPADLRGWTDELLAVLVVGKGPLWHRAPGGFIVHDYFDWNDTREVILRERERSKDRVGRFRQRQKADREAAAAAAVTALQTAHETPAERRTTSTTEDQRQQEQRPAAALRMRLPVENRRVLLKVAHSVLDEVDAGKVIDLEAEIAEQVKTRAAQIGLCYTGTREAIDSARHQRSRRAARS
jgi:hypothetical protein